MTARLLKTKDVCDILGVCSRTLYSIARSNECMRPVMVGRTMRWHAWQVDEYTGKRTRAGSEPASVGNAAA